MPNACRGHSEGYAKVRWIRPGLVLFPSSVPGHSLPEPAQLSYQYSNCTSKEEDIQGVLVFSV